MATNLSKELINRLICSKYLYLRGVDILNQRGPFSEGAAVLHFQDAAEMTLRVVAEHLNCSLKENAAFNQLIDAIDSTTHSKVPNRSALNQLNKARRNFKHFGLEPKYEDVCKFRSDLEGFLPAAFSSFLHVDYYSISLANLIGHVRTENFLNDAERLIGEGKHKEAISACAAAFAIFQSHYRSESGGYRADPFLRFKVEDRALESWAKDIDETVEALQHQLDLIMLGINIAEYRRFKRYAPIVHLTAAGTLHIVYGAFGNKVEPTKEDAMFCHRFAIDSILTMKTNELPPQLPVKDSQRKFRVVRKGPIIVWPCENPEIIRYGEEGEILLGRPPKNDKSKYVAITQDGDNAYIAEESVEIA